MMTIGVIAAPRDVDVNHTIAELRTAGFAEPIHVFCEPGTRAIPPAASLTVHTNDDTRGGLGNWAHCLQWLVENTETPYLLVCEDDVVYCSRAAELLKNFLLERPADFGFASLYTPRHDAKIAADRLGWHSWNRGRETWGTQAMCFNRTSAACLLRYAPLYTEDQLSGPTDAIVGQCFLKADLPCFYHVPSLADHIGRVSAVGRRWTNRNTGLGFVR